MQVHILDVGQGDAILIEAPGDKTVLIDAGTSKSGVPENLRKRGIKRLDLVIASHPHADHIGGMPSVLKEFDVGAYVDNGMTHTTMTYARTLQAIESKDIQYQRGVNGRSFNVGPEVKLKILHPRSTLLRGTRSDLNSNSVVVRLDHKDVCFLFTGDAEDPTERDLLNRGLNQCEVLKVAHHGSKHSTSDSVLQAVQPKFAAISAGAGNRYGHPAPETLARLERAEVKVHRTDLEGTITFISSGRSISVRSQRTPSEQTVAATVNTETKPSPAAHTHAAPSASAVTAATGNSVNINTASAADLQSFHGIGPSKSAAIITDREANGPFSSCADIQRVHGIGPATVAAMKGRCVTESDDAVADTEKKHEASAVEEASPVHEHPTADKPAKVVAEPESFRWWQLLKKLRSNKGNGETESTDIAA